MLPQVHSGGSGALSFHLVPVSESVLCQHWLAHRASCAGHMPDSQHAGHRPAGVRWV